MSIRETEKFQRGRRGERIVCSFLQGRGWYVVPSYDYVTDQEKAPMMHGIHTGFVLPDLDASRGGRRCWFEVKTKERADLYRKLNRLEHGMPLRHFRDYQHVQRESGCSVWVTVYEEESRQILSIHLGELERVKRTYEGQKMDRGGMVFWPRDSMRLLFTFKDRNAA